MTTYRDALVVAPLTIVQGTVGQVGVRIREMARGPSGRSPTTLDDFNDPTERPGDARSLATLTDLSVGEFSHQD